MAMGRWCGSASLWAGDWKARAASLYQGTRTRHAPLDCCAVATRSTGVGDRVIRVTRQVALPASSVRTPSRNPCACLRARRKGVLRASTAFVSMRAPQCARKSTGPIASKLLVPKIAHAMWRWSPRFQARRGWSASSDAAKALLPAQQEWPAMGRNANLPAPHRLLIRAGRAITASSASWTDPLFACRNRGSCSDRSASTRTLGGPHHPGGGCR